MVRQEYFIQFDGVFHIFVLDDLDELLLEIGEQYASVVLVLLIPITLSLTLFLPSLLVPTEQILPFLLRLVPPEVDLHRCVNDLPRAFAADTHFTQHFQPLRLPLSLALVLMKTQQVKSGCLRPDSISGALGIALFGRVRESLDQDLVSFNLDFLLHLPPLSQHHAQTLLEMPLVFRVVHPLQKLQIVILDHTALLLVETDTLLELMVLQKVLRSGLVVGLSLILLFVHGVRVATEACVLGKGGGTAGGGQAFLQGGGGLVGQELGCLLLQFLQTSIHFLVFDFNKLLFS